MKKTKKSPSRIKYEHNHPTVSFRVTKEIEDRLAALKQADGKSIADILKAGLGLIESKIRDEEVIRREGYKQGYLKAKGLYIVVYPCAKCGKFIEVKSPEEKKSIRDYMKENGWSHTECGDNDED